MRSTVFHAALAAAMLLIAACDGGPTGTLDLVITGLPDGASAQVAIAGPGFGAVAAQSRTFGNVGTGSYTVIAPDVTVGEDTYAAVGAGTFTVSKDATTSVDIVYGPVAATGSLELTISGLPAGVAGEVTIVQPGGFMLTAGASATYENLSAGAYEITPSAVQAGFDEYASAGGGTVEVVAGATATVAVDYSLVPVETGTLMVEIGGLPAGLAPAVAVTGPRGFSETPAASAIYANVPVGTYEVAVADATGAAGTWAAPGAGSFEVEAGQETVVQIAYAEVFGSIDLVITGLPGVSSASVRVTGPDGYDETFTSSTVIAGLSTGDYLIAPDDVTPFAVKYASRDTATVSVAADAAATALVNYFAPRILLYTDNDTVDVVAHILPALTALGYEWDHITGTGTAGSAGNARDSAEFAISTEFYDLVLWFAYDWFSSSTIPDAQVIEHYLAAGGRMLYSNFDQQQALYEDFYALLGGTPGSNTNWTEAVMEIEALHTSVGAALPIKSTSPPNIRARNIVPAPHGTSVCLITGTTNSCAVLANGGRTLWLGHVLQTIDDIDLAHEFYGIAVRFLLGLGD